MNWQATSSKACLESPKELLPPADQAQMPETATEAEELPIGAAEQGD